MIFKRGFFIVILLVLFLGLASPASAWVIGEPLVPCGSFIPAPGGVGPPQPQPPCTQCELLHLVDNLMDFILIGAAPILATVFFIFAGLYIMLGGARPDMLATGKRMFTSALTGIIIVMLAWLITNTLITTLVAPTVSGQLPSGSIFSFNSAGWWDLTCTEVGLSPNPPGTGGGGGGGGGGGTGVTINNFDLNPKTVSGNNPTVTATISLTFNLAVWTSYCGASSTPNADLSILEYSPRSTAWEWINMPISTTASLNTSVNLGSGAVGTREFYLLILCNNNGRRATSSSNVPITQQ